MTGRAELCLPPAIRVGSVAAGRIVLSEALALDRPAVLLSAAGLAIGPGWWRAAIAKWRTAAPTVGLMAVLDCGNRPGAVMAALRTGIADIRYGGAESDALAGLADRHGARLWRRLGPVLDLDLRRDPQAACRDWLRRVPLQSKGLCTIPTATETTDPTATEPAIHADPRGLR